MLLIVLMNVHPVLELLQRDERAAVKQVVEAYEASDCEISGTVRELGASRQTFYRWLRDYPVLSKALSEARLRRAREVLAAHRQKARA